MNSPDYDDGLVHNHDWAAEAVTTPTKFRVCETALVPTPSCVFHDDEHEIN